MKLSWRPNASISSTGLLLFRQNRHRAAEGAVLLVCLCVAVWDVTSFLQQRETEVKREQETDRNTQQDQRLSKISFIVLIVDIVPQKCRVRSHKSRAETIPSSYSSCHSLRLHLCINIYSLMGLLLGGAGEFTSPRRGRETQTETFGWRYVFPM